MVLCGNLALYAFFVVVVVYGHDTKDCIPWPASKMKYGAIGKFSIKYYVANLTLKRVP